MKAALVILFSIFSLTAQAGDPIKNFGDVNGSISRGARPDEGDIEWLSKQHFGTILNLEDNFEKVDRESGWASHYGLKFISIPFDSDDAYPSDSAVEQALQVMQNPANYPLFIHCHHGENRTGMMVGLYRVFVDHYSPEDAYREMLNYGFDSEENPNLLAYFRTKTGFTGGL